MGDRWRSQVCCRSFRLDRGRAAWRCRPELYAVGQNLLSVDLPLNASRHWRRKSKRAMSFPTSGILTKYRSHVALDAANRERGTDFLRQVYGDERAANMFEKWGGDFEWLTKDIVYGLFHADDSVFDTLETELITYTAIVCQGLRLHVPMANFLGGLKRLNLSLKEAEGVTACAEMVAKWAGQDTSSWPRVGDLIADWE